MAIDLFNNGLGDHGLTIEPIEFDPVQDPELQEEVSVEVKFKRYGDFVSLNEMELEDLNFSLPDPSEVQEWHCGLMHPMRVISLLFPVPMKSIISLTRLILNKATWALYEQT